LKTGAKYAIVQQAGTAVNIMALLERDLHRSRLNIQKDPCGRQFAILSSEEMENIEEIIRTPQPPSPQLIEAMRRHSKRASSAR
jgi:hypothetical protein